MPTNKQAEVLLELQKPIVPDATFLKTTARNSERGLNILAKPFMVGSDLESAGLLDKAGPRYIFKIGPLIGPQRAVPAGSAAVRRQERLQPRV